MSVLDMVNAPWAVMPDTLREIQSIYVARMTGNARDLLEVEAALGRPLDNHHRNYEVIDGVAVIPIHGVIAKRANLFSAISGGVSTELVGLEIQTALEDRSVQSILLDVDSPGGSVDGLPELANLIFESRDQKKIVALANGTMASAAYWIGSAASEVYASSETTAVGSIGVVATHTDVSVSQATEGVKTTEIYAGKFKRIASQFEPLTDDGKASIQAQVDYLYSVFVGAVAKHHAMSTDAVLENMADARIFIGQQSVDAGLVKAIQTKEQIISMLTAGQGGSGATIFGAVAENLNQPTSGEAISMNTEEIQTKYPDAAAAFRTEGATAERQRIQDVNAQSIPGHEALINGLAFDGKTTGPEAAVQVLGAHRKEVASIAANLQSDAPAALDAIASEEGAQDDSGSESSSAASPAVVAQRAQEMVAEAESAGRKLTLSAAVKQATAELA
jgi:signal peptide peptidase SppA